MGSPLAYPLDCEVSLKEWLKKQEANYKMVSDVLRERRNEVNTWSVFQVPNPPQAPAERPGRYVGGTVRTSRYVGGTVRTSRYVGSHKAPAA